ncbi:hypothetical protein B0T24DRAFT_721242 [Lasiosphaeria ovina]|uniref:Uncharacterized protein n=1 Tax=Lasiosphaeria ovina TaxID=92902 RepID=A0AAE0K7L9_9PEZI|nr:hypothetical protein B0T24DRAFT_721242 [Lasiosphaeria ovina]
MAVPSQAPAAASLPPMTKIPAPPGTVVTSTPARIANMSTTATVTTTTALALPTKTRAIIMALSVVLLHNDNIGVRWTARSYNLFVASLGIATVVPFLAAVLRWAAASAALLAAHLSSATTHLFLNTGNYGVALGEKIPIKWNYDWLPPSWLECEEYELHIWNGTHADYSPLFYYPADEARRSDPESSDPFTSIDIIGASPTDGAPPTGTATIRNPAGSGTSAAPSHAPHSTTIYELLGLSSTASLLPLTLLRGGGRQQQPQQIAELPPEMQAGELWGGGVDIARGRAGLAVPGTSVLLKGGRGRSSDVDDPPLAKGGGGAPHAGCDTERLVGRYEEEQPAVVIVVGGFDFLLLVVGCVVGGPPRWKATVVVLAPGGHGHGGDY